MPLHLRGGGANKQLSRASRGDEAHVGVTHPDFSQQTNSMGTWVVGQGGQDGLLMCPLFLVYNFDNHLLRSGTGTPSSVVHTPHLIANTPNMRRMRRSVSPRTHTHTRSTRNLLCQDSLAACHQRRKTPEVAGIAAAHPIAQPQPTQPGRTQPMCRLACQVPYMHAGRCAGGSPTHHRSTTQYRSLAYQTWQWWLGADMVGRRVGP